MVDTKVIGRVEVSIGNVKIINIDGEFRSVAYGDLMYEGEQLVSHDPATLFQIKYLSLPEATVYDGVFGVLSDGSVIVDADEVVALFGDKDAQNLETASGEERIEGSSGIGEDAGIIAKSSVLEFDRGEDSEFGLGITDHGSSLINFSKNVGDQTPPIITSANVTVFNENSTDAVLQVSADDSSTLTFSIEDGLDGALFSIDAEGVIRFNDSPDYETPQDLGNDNEYNISITVTDAFGNFTTQFISVHVNNLNDNNPITENINDTAIEDGAIVSGQVIGSDADGDVIEFVQMSDVAEGTLIFNSSGSYTFDVGNDFQDLAKGETRDVTFTYKAVETTTPEGFESAPESTVTITVTGTNDAPIAAIDNNFTDRFTNDGSTATILDNWGNSYAQMDTNTITNDRVQQISETEAEIALTTIIGNYNDWDGVRIYLFEGEVLRLTSNSGTNDYYLGIDDSDHTNGNLDPITGAFRWDALALTTEAGQTVSVTTQNDGWYYIGTGSMYGVTDYGGFNTTITINGVDVSTTENTILTIDVLANDTDVDNGAVLTLDDVNVAPGEGSVSIVDNKLEFNPGTDFDHLAEGETATVTVSYTMSDEHNASSSSVAILTITGTNDAPVAVLDGTTAISVNSVSSGDALVFDSRGDNPELLGGATSIDLSVTISNDSNNSNSILSYASSEDNNDFLIFTNDTGTSIGIYIDGFSHYVSVGGTIYDGTPHEISVSWDSATGNTIVSVDGVQKGAFTLVQGHTIGENGVLMLGQEQDSVGESLDNNQIFSGEYHDLSISTNGTEVAHWEMETIDNGVVIDSVGNFDLSVVANANVAQHDSLLTTTEDTSLEIDVNTLLANDTDIDGGALSVISVQDAVDGVVNLNMATGKITFTPDANHNGEASFTYTISDGNGGFDTTTVFLNVTPVNDAPIAVADSYVGNFDTIAVNTNTTDGALIFDSTGANPELLGGATSIDLSVTISTDSNNSNSILSYASSQSNNDFLIFTNDTGTSIGIYIDGAVKSVSTATIYDGNPHTISVNWDNTEGTTIVSVDGIVKGSFIGHAQGHTIGEKGVLMLGQEQDSVGGNLDTNQIFSGEYHDLSISTNGTQVAHWEMETIDNGVVVDSLGNFDLSVDGDVVVIPHASPLVTDEDTPLIIDFTTLLANDNDIDGDSLTISSVNNPTNGTVDIVNGEVVFTPTANYSGEASFEYTVSDGNGGIDTATVNLFVNSVNDAPTIDAVEVSPPANNMVFWYDLNVDGTDLSGNGRSATDTNGDGIYTIDDDNAINLGSYAQKTIAVSFTTAVVDASDPFQVIYEQGGTVNGYSISTIGNHAYAFIWGESYGIDYKTIELGEVSSNAEYSVVMVHDAYENGVGTMSAYLNGTLIDTLDDVGVMGAHSGNVGIGGYDNDTVHPLTYANVSGDGGEFSGTIGELMSWNDVLSSQQVSDVFSHLSGSDDTVIFVDEATYDTATQLFNISASDIEGDPITYSLDNDFVGLFAIDAVSGEITVKGVLDYDIATSYTLVVNASDNLGATTSRTLIVNVQQENELVVELNMNGNLNDSATAGSVNDNGIARNGADTLGGVLVLDGINDYVQFSSSNDINKLDYEQRSVSLWFKTDDAVGTQYLYAEGGGTRSLQIYMQDGQLMAKGYNDRTVAQGENDWSTPTILDANIDVADGEWHNVTITLCGDATDPMYSLSSDGFKLYLDGINVDSGVGGAIYGHNPAFVGSDYSRANTFDGKIENVRIFNEELSENDISLLNSEGNIGTSNADNIVYDNDTIIYEGGGGIDILAVDSNDTFDLSNVGDISNIEIIKLEEDADILATITASDVITMTDTNNMLIINGDNSNHISSIDSSLTKVADTISGYDTYTGEGGVMLLIEDYIVIDG